MILPDTSIWIDHLGHTDARLQTLLDADLAVMHAYVLGEIALGSLPKRRLILDAMREMPQAIIADAAEVLQFIENHNLYALGIGYVDVHILASCFLTPGTRLWTRDKRLLAAASRLDLAAQLDH